MRRAIQERRSIREFADRDIDDALIDTLIQAAQWAPSAWDLQPWRFVVVRGREMRLEIARRACERLAEERGEPLTLDRLAPDLGIDAAVQVFVCADTRGIAHERKRRECYASCHAAIQNMLLAAHVLGLGACWQNEPLLAADTIRMLLRLPDLVELVGTVAIGYPATAPPPPPLRSHTSQELVFHEGFD